MKQHRDEQKQKELVEETQKLTESVEGRRVLEGVRSVHERLAKLLANAPAGTIATRIRRDLEDIRDSLNV
jgi:hypothetical protein